MNHINVSLTVGCAPDETMLRLEEFLREHAPQTEMTFTLRAPFDISALNVGLTLHREVTANFTPLGADKRAYAIAWQPTQPGPFPALAGTIFVATNESNPTESIVTLDGHYHAPLGVAGEVFDMLIGKHIAQASAADLLARIGAYIDPAIEPAPATADVLVPASAFG